MGVLCSRDGQTFSSSAFSAYRLGELHPWMLACEKHLVISGSRRILADIQGMIGQERYYLRLVYPFSMDGPSLQPLQYSNLLKLSPPTETRNHH